MANHLAIHLVGLSLIKYLNSVLPTDPHDPMFGVQFKLVSIGELNSNATFERTVTLCLYRVAIDPYTRNQPNREDPSRPSVPLAVSLQYLFTVWAGNAQDEQVPLAWLMRQLHQHESLSPSELIPDAGWSASDVIQVVPSEITIEEMMRIWDALDASYRLSLSYTARVVRIDADTSPDARPVVARRLDFDQPAGLGQAK